ncbi:MAG: hypothetical protein HC786_25790 [Richelia sp. CSU_2_1]|nr:hypothetical protein [Richelia sp. CSU_2_1]
MRSRMRWLIAVLLALGIFFRFANIDKKIYGLDESYTSLRISSYTEAELVQDLSKTRIIGADYLKKYQQVSTERNFLGTIQGLSTEEPQHPPLYYVIARLWAQLLGDSVTATRILPALLSLLAFPGIYWLCLELFNSQLTGWLAVALLAVSPFNVVYAQEARQYSLWTAIVLLSSASLLRAIRLNTPLSWGLYAVTLAANFYTFLLSILIAAGHGFYMLVIEKFKFTKTFVSYLIASALGAIAFCPWVFIVISNWSRVQHTTNWKETARPSAIAQLWKLFRGWTRQPGRPFFDLNVSPQDWIGVRATQSLFTLICLILVAYSLYFLYKTTQKRSWLFVFTLIGGTGIGLTLQDLILKGQDGSSSTIPRYLIPCYLGFQIAVAHLLTNKITQHDSVKSKERWLWNGVLALIISGGILSSAVSSESKIWWNKGGVEYLEYNLSAARLINQSKNPLLISDCDSWGLLFSSHLLDPKVKMLVKPYCFSCSLKTQQDFQPNLSKEAAGFSDIFLFPRPSDSLLNFLKNQPNYQIKEAVKAQSSDSVLWKIEKVVAP